MLISGRRMRARGSMTVLLLLLPLFVLVVCLRIGSNCGVTAAALAETEGDKEETQHGAQLPSSISLSDGHFMPRVGLGVALTAERTYEAVTHAIQMGYGLIDTASEESYGNEDQVGKAVRNYYRNRSQNKIFVTTKLWDDDHGFYSTLRAFWKSYHELNKFPAAASHESDNDKINSSNNRSIPIDLYLVHSPFGGRLVETWDALLWLQEHHGDKLVSIGVSNFGIDHLEVLREAGRPMPVVNQIEMHPLVYSQRQDLLDYCQKHKIAIQAFGSLMHGYPHFLTDPPPVLSEMVNRYNNSPQGRRVDYAVYNHYDSFDDEDETPSTTNITVAHVLLQWALQHGFAIIPKSSRKKRITENVRYIHLGGESSTVARDAAATRNKPDFVLSEDDMEILDRWGDHVRYEDRNIYKEDWNWNPIDEAPLHFGREDYWPNYERLAGMTDLDEILRDRLGEPGGLGDHEEEYWHEYWENAIHLEDDDEEENYFDGDYDHEEL